MPKIPFKQFMKKLNDKAAFPKRKDVLVRQGKLFPDDQAESPDVLKAYRPNPKPRQYLKKNKVTGEHEIHNHNSYGDEPREIYFLAADGHRIGGWSYTPMTWNNKASAEKWLGRYASADPIYDKLVDEVRKMKSDFIHLYYINGMEIDETYRKQNVAILAFAKAIKAMRMKKPAIMFFEVGYGGPIEKPYMDYNRTLARFYESMGFDIAHNDNGYSDGYWGYKVFT